MATKRPLEVEDGDILVVSIKKPRLNDKTEAPIVTPVVPYLFIAPFELSDTGTLCTTWSPLSTPECAVIEDAIQHAVELNQQINDVGELGPPSHSPDCYVGTLLVIIQELSKGILERDKKGKALCLHHWPTLFTVKNFGDWMSEDRSVYKTVHTILYYAEDPY